MRQQGGGRRCGPGHGARSPWARTTSCDVVHGDTPPGTVYTEHDDARVT